MHKCFEHVAVRSDLDRRECQLQVLKKLFQVAVRETDTEQVTQPEDSDGPLFYFIVFVDQPESLSSSQLPPVFPGFPLGGSRKLPPEGTSRYLTDCAGELSTETVTCSITLT